MSARVKWAIVPKNRLWHSTEGQSRLASAIEEMFGSEAPTLGDDDVPALRGMAAAGVPGAEDLVRAIQEHGSIEVRVER